VNPLTLGKTFAQQSIDRSTRDPAMISNVLVRLALKRIAERLCGPFPGNICVLVSSANMPRIYIASVPVKCRAALQHYLAERIGVSIPRGNDPLILSAEEAIVAIELGEQIRRSDGRGEVADAEFGGSSGRPMRPAVSA
jgi:hypothetical protein